MSTERAHALRLFSLQHPNEWSLPQRSLKRKIGSLLPPARQGDFSYPSPPMSSPPSPTRQPAERSQSAGFASGPLTTTGAVSTTSFVPGPAVAPPSTLFAVPPTRSEPTIYGPPPTAPPTSPPVGPSPATFRTPQAGLSICTAPYTASVATAGPSGVSPSTIRAGRKSKAHVASACVNCKRAHLSCDVNRPCARCIASGKQDTCFDVQHKKRGRPRLREESEFKVEQMVPEQSMRTPIPAAAGPSTARPIAATRHRRTESLRSLRSQTSEGSSPAGIPTPGYAPPALQAPFSYFPPPPPALSAAEVPTAYLDMDFTFIKANRPFEQILANGQDVRGGQLSDVAASADNESFQGIRNGLRTEREAREPAYMPPILQAGQDPLFNVCEADVDRLTQGFRDQTYTWTRSQQGQSQEIFPARVRLAKADIYFVAITLPSFRPVTPQYPSPYSASTFAATPSQPNPGGFTPQRPGATQSAPPSFYYPYAPQAGQLPPEQMGGQPLAPARTYPPYQPQPQQAYSPYPPRPQPTTPRLPPPEQPTGVTPLMPRAMAPEAARPPQAALQLPPLGGAPAPPGASDVAGQQGSSSEGEGEESPKKRRRMGIHDVLQR